jgi:hypothetical protein
VDPVTVPLDGWEAIRLEDARLRKAVWDLSIEFQLFPGVKIVVVGEGRHAGR